MALIYSSIPGIFVWKLMNRDETTGQREPEHDQGPAARNIKRRSQLEPVNTHIGGSSLNALQHVITISTLDTVVHSH